MQVVPLIAMSITRVRLVYMPPIGTYRHHISHFQPPYDDVGIFLLPVPSRTGVLLIEKSIDARILLVVGGYDNDGEYTGIPLVVCIY